MSKLLASINTLEELIEKVPDTETRLKGIFNYLQASERMLINWIDEVRGGIQTSPADADGDLEYGLHLYWLHHLDEEQMKSITGDSQAYATVLTALRRYAPDSSITSKDLEDYSEKLLRGKDKHPKDGAMWTKDKYGRLDYKWLTAILNLTINLLDPKSIYHPYPNFEDAYKRPIDKEKESISIAIIGDWGCGPYGDKFGGNGPAVAVMKAVKNLKPDYVVHLGDIYYCGTGHDRYIPDEAEKNFIKVWEETGPTNAGTNFTLNSNHDMYGGANGLFKVVFNHKLFAHQNKAPYFALEYNNWVIIGLDSAYFDKSELYMKGAFGDENNTQQKDFVKSLGDLSGKKIMVMTHHNPIDFKGEKIESGGGADENGLYDGNEKSLCEGMKELLGGRTPDIWYWGHKHLGVAYSVKLFHDGNGTVTLRKDGIDGTLTTCRCVGHSAIPIVAPSEINKDNVDYYAHTAIGDGSKQVQNGFATITLKKDGSVSESFYEVTNEGGYEEKWTTKP